jgi:hypothetical protein
MLQDIMKGLGGVMGGGAAAQGMQSGGLMNMLQSGMFGGLPAQQPPAQAGIPAMDALRLATAGPGQGVQVGGPYSPFPQPTSSPQLTPQLWQLIQALGQGPY